jgi:hypothetical protein
LSSEFTREFTDGGKSEGSGVSTVGMQTATEDRIALAMHGANHLNTTFGALSNDPDGVPVAFHYLNRARLSHPIPASRKTFTSTRAL